MKNRIIKTFTLSTLNNLQNNYNNFHTGGAEARGRELTPLSGHMKTMEFNSQ